ncbi:MAG: protein kinase [Acidobacteriota bacterium]
MNPYLNRAMIRQPEDFFGRRSEVARILSRLGADPPQSVSLVGERRIGKSSLLFHFTNPSVQKEALGERADSLTTVFLDCQQLGRTTVEDFFGLLLKRIGFQSDDEAPEGGGYGSFRRCLEGLEKKERKLALLLDEFDAVTSNPAFGPDFYSFLRSMANNYPVAYLTSSKTELQRLCFSEEISDSPFFNIFTNLYLKPFPVQEAEELIAVPSQRQGHPLKPFEPQIFEMAGHFPFYLQIACSAFFEEAAEKPGRQPDQAVVQGRFLEEAAPHFEHYWGQAPAEARQAMRRIIRQEQPPPEERHTCQRLERTGYLRGGRGHYQIFSSLFAQHIGSLEAGSDETRTGSALLEGSLLQPGSRLHQYRILNKAGEGGMGVIYQAEDTSLNRRVALKFIQPRVSRSPLTRKRFLQEARAAAALNHPAITSVFELFEHEGQVVLVMEWIEGRSLKQLIRQEGPVEWQRLAGWMAQACKGLEEAHRQGIVHRDIKSSNLMLSSDDKIKITDFGLAKEWRDGTAISSDDDLTQEGTLLGTIDYISPEQARGEPVDGRSDLYSLGVVIFEGLTGQLPFHRKTPAATLKAIFSEPPPYLGLYNLDNADRLDRTVRKLLEKSPRKRHESAAELHKELRAMLKKKRFLGLFG